MDSQPVHKDNNLYSTHISQFAKELVEAAVVTNKLLLPLLLLLCLCVGESPAQGPPVVFFVVFLGCSACAILQGTQLAGSWVNLGHACGCVDSRDLDPYDLELIVSLSSVFLSLYPSTYRSIYLLMRPNRPKQFCLQF